MLLPTSFRLRLRPLASSWIRQSYNCSAPNPCRWTSSSSHAALQGVTGYESKKPFYVTTPIFYVNAAPHVGHMYSMVLADVFKRWQLLQGRKAILCTGTDEYGMKVQQAANLAGVPPKEFCDAGAANFRSLAERIGLSNDHFIRTTDADHHDAVQYFWDMLQQRGHIYQAKHEGWYCVSDETFYPESGVQMKLDPVDGRTYMSSIETGKEVEWTSETNYHFRLSAFRERLLDFYAANPDFILPKSRMNEVVASVFAGLSDLSISRPTQRLSWGVRVPNDDSQTIYVWLDALINYITKAGYPWEQSRAQSGGWPADIQVVGKDIVRFHAVYWPAFLMALDIDPPKQLLAHAHWTLNKQKMAKSTGNVVDPFFAIDRFGVDAVRFYLVVNAALEQDSDYSNYRIVRQYKSCLVGDIGNLVNRLMKSKCWSVTRAIQSQNLAVSARARKRADDDLTTEHAQLIVTTRGVLLQNMIRLRPDLALTSIIHLARQTNKYIDQQAPWKLSKTTAAEDVIKLNSTIYHVADAARVMGILLQPFIPEKAAQMLDILGVDGSKRTFDHATLGADFQFGTPWRSPGVDAYDSLFPPLLSED